MHATSLEYPTLTACGRTFAGRGWRVSLRIVSCRLCALAVQLDARPKKTKRARSSSSERAA